MIPGRLLVVAAATVLALCGCGVPVDESADVASTEEVPFGLLDEDRQPIANPFPSDEAPTETFLYDDDQQRLFSVLRRVGSASLDAVLAELEQPPSPGETTANLRSALSDTEAIGSTEVEAGVAVVDLTEDFTTISGADQRIAIAQLVFTATARPGIDQVSVTLDGQPIEVPRGDGSLTSSTLTRDDYPSLAPFD